MNQCGSISRKPGTKKKGRAGGESARGNNTSASSSSRRSKRKGPRVRTFARSDIEMGGLDSARGAFHNLLEQEASGSLEIRSPFTAVSYPDTEAGANKKRKHRAQVEELKSREAHSQHRTPEVLFLGSSHCERWFWYAPQQRRRLHGVYVEAMPWCDATHFPRSPETSDSPSNHETPLFANAGVGGDRTYNLLWRMRNGLLNCGAFTHSASNSDSGTCEGCPKFVVLVIGGNNLDKDNEADVALGTKMVLDEVHAQMPCSHIILMSVFVATKHTATWNNRAAVVSVLFHEMAGERPYVSILDIRHEFFGPDDVVRHDMFEDGLHLSNLGYEIWANSLVRHIQTLIS